MTQLSLFMVAPATRAELTRAGYTSQGMYCEWPDGHVGMGAVIRCRDRVVAAAPREVMLAVAQEHHATGRIPRDLAAQCINVTEDTREA